MRDLTSKRDWICDRCFARYSDEAQVIRLQHQCGECDGRLYRNGINRTSIPRADAAGDADRLSRLVARFGAKLKERTRERDVAMRQIKAIRVSVAALAQRALNSKQPEDWQNALRALVAQARLAEVMEEQRVLRVIEMPCEVQNETNGMTEELKEQGTRT